VFNLFSEMTNFTSEFERQMVDLVHGGRTPACNVILEDRSVMLFMGGA
jgi:hypothetical protein